MWKDLWNDPLAQLVIWGALAGTLVAIAFYLVGRIRNEAAQKEPSASELISKFREMHAQGGLSEAEFRTIKTTLATRLQDEIKDTGGTG